MLGIEKLGTRNFINPTSLRQSYFLLHLSESDST